jgi:hypothetical protein
VAQPYYQQQPRPAARPRRRRRHGVWQLVVGLTLILLVVLAVVDRVAAAIAASELRSRVAAELAAHDVGYSSLDVTVGGIPFLTQVVQGRYDSLSINLTQLHLTEDGREATLPRLDVTATGVAVDTLALARGDTSATADQVTGSALVSYETLSSLVDLSQYHLADLTFSDRDGALWARGDVSALGVSLPVEAEAEISVRNGQFEVRLRGLKAVGASVPNVALPMLDSIANAVIVATVPALPFGITVNDFQVAPGGLAITATGHKVTLVQRSGTG